jgi:hypothetical protein
VGGGYLFGQIPLIRDNLGVILIFGIGIVLGPLFLLGLWRAARKWMQNGSVAMKPAPATVQRAPERER